MSFKFLLSCLLVLIFFLQLFKFIKNKKKSDLALGLIFLISGAHSLLVFYDSSLTSGLLGYRSITYAILVAAIFYTSFIYMEQKKKAYIIVIAFIACVFTTKVLCDIQPNVKEVFLKVVAGDKRCVA